MSDVQQALQASSSAETVAFRKVVSIDFWVDYFVYFEIIND